MVEIKMVTVLIILALVATLVSVAPGSELSECDTLSQSFASNNQTLEFIQENCPTKTLLRHIGYVNIALYTPEGAGPYKNYRIDRELKEEQAKWVAEAEIKVSQYWYELANLISSPKMSRRKAIEFPSSKGIDSLLNEVDDDNKEFAFTDQFTQYYYATHMHDEGLIRLFGAMEYNNPLYYQGIE